MITMVKWQSNILEIPKEWEMVNSREAKEFAQFIKEQKEISRLINLGIAYFKGKDAYTVHSDYVSTMIGGAFVQLRFQPRESTLENSFTLYIGGVGVSKAKEFTTPKEAYEFIEEIRKEFIDYDEIENMDRQELDSIIDTHNLNIDKQLRLRALRQDVIEALKVKELDNATG